MIYGSIQNNSKIRLDIRIVRIMLGLSPKLVSTHLGISVQTLYKYEKNPSTTPLYIAKRLSSYYNVSLDELDYS
ncbi:helix-turn-helix domain-containing protein [Paenibacillus pabuli]|uniref:helix-turn-helix domain-containing protein n=1 Tax=Paenibacillus TaxID=44249 RepID=UPI000D70DA14